MHLLLQPMQQVIELDKYENKQRIQNWIFLSYFFYDTH